MICTAEAGSPWTELPKRLDGRTGHFQTLLTSAELSALMTHCEYILMPFQP
eukprot:CAMPEP_0168413610 /NCGR_PEP_ID=MMETSP0228-20121227/29307_1 /TAXON_ID=133427 /ORGANISM="Protoceratium reticulatum, Strain CCCM 535 (=CCMP 1889)" /LENGTH=50 /DNA_ID=CAMNT_0008427397 /DNA_START=33 /DNA_END=181 /DNA_ORIENTATION=-